VGAVALVVFVVIALPIVLDREPKPISQDLTIQIPSQDATKFNTKVLPPEEGAKDGAAGKAAPSTQAPSTSASAGAASTMPAAPAAGSGGAGEVPKTAAVAQTAPPTLPEPKAETKLPEARTAKAEATPAVKPKAEAKPAAKPVEAAKAAESKTTAEGEAFFVPLGSYVKQENVRQVQSKVTSAGFKSYSEKLASGQIRLRAGPFTSRDAAETARNKLKSSGIDVGAVGSAAKG